MVNNLPFFNKDAQDFSLNITMVWLVWNYLAVFFTPFTFKWLLRRYRQVDFELIDRIRCLSTRALYYLRFYHSLLRLHSRIHLWDLLAIDWCLEFKRVDRHRMLWVNTEACLWKALRLLTRSELLALFLFSDFESLYLLFGRFHSLPPFKQHKAAQS